MAKQTAIFSDEYKVPRGTTNFSQKATYTITKSLDDSQGSVVEIVKEFENVKESLREIADKVGCTYDVKWNTQEFGRQLVNQFGQDKEANIAGYSVVIADDKSVKTSQIFKGDDAKNELAKISQKAGFEIADKAETWGLAGGLIDFLNQKNKSKMDTISPNTEGDADWKWWTSLDKEWQEILLQDGLELDDTDFDWSDKETVQDYLSQILDLTTLELSAKNISNITPLANLKNLTELNLAQNGISDISALVNLVNLTILNLKDNIITDISALVNLTQLNDLDLSDNNITDVSALANLINLTDLSLSYNEIRDAKPLANLKKLDFLYLRNNRLPETDIEYLEEQLTGCEVMRGFVYNDDKDWEWWIELDEEWQNLLLKKGLGLEDIELDKSDKEAMQAYIPKILNLENLTMKDCSISELAPLAHLTHLTRLSLEGNDAYIYDLNSLRKLTNLQELEVVSNDIGDVSALPNVRNLTKLDIYHSSFDTSILPKLKHLTCLDLIDMEIDDKSILENLTNLTHLSMTVLDSGNDTIDVSLLKNLTNLKELYLDANAISDISTLANLTNLSELSLEGNEITDISPLAGLTNLTLLKLAYNSISDVSALTNLVNLKNLEIWENDISESDIDSLKKQLPNCEIELEES